MHAMGQKWVVAQAQQLCWLLCSRWLPGYDCTLLARYFRYACVCPLTTLVFSCSLTSAAAPSFSLGYARHHHLRFTPSSAVWFSLSSSFSFFPSYQHGGK